MLAELARTDAHNHRSVAGDSDLAEAAKVLGRAQQSMTSPSSPTGSGYAKGQP